MAGGERIITSLWANVPIPTGGRMDGWKAIPIASELSANEKLIDLAKLPSGYGIVVEPKYFLDGVSGATFEQKLREEAVVRLVRAARLVASEGLRIKVWDAHRPLETQQGLFDGFWRMLSVASPSLSYEQLMALTQTYVSVPSENITRPSPHFTGGPVDVTLVDRAGRELNMGTGFDHFGPEAATAYFENPRNIVTLSDVEAMMNRRRLYHAMIGAGFSNYSEEWWHFDFGNQFYARMTGRQAKYGPIAK